MTTPSMLLTLPTVSVTLGPAWASQLNIALEAIDLHDHTANKGVKVPSAGLNINADLSFANNALLAVKHVGIATDSVDPAIAGAVYVKNGDLYYTATNLTPVQLTNGTSIQGVAGNISGLGDGGSTAAFNDFTEDFTFKYAAGDRFAAFNLGELRVYPFDGVNPYTNPITIKAPLALATAYQLTLPLTLPVADNVLSVTSAGVIKQGLGDGSAAIPPISFASDTNTGLYKVGTDVLGITAGGLWVATFASGGNITITPTGKIWNASGTASLPGYSFNSNPNDGMYLITTNNVGISTAGVKRLDISNTGLAVTGTLSATGAVSGSSLSTAGSITGASVSGGTITGTSLNVGSGSLTAGAAAVSSINTSGGGAVRMRTYTGSLAPSASINISPGGTVLGAVGMSTNPFDGTWVPMSITSTIDQIRINGGNGTGLQIGLLNPSGGSTLSYTVTVLYT